MEQNLNQNNPNEIDVRKIVRVVLEHWWWFLVGVVCCMLLGVAYMMRKSPTYTTDAAIMLRQSDDAFTGVEALTMLGLSGNTAAEDEVVVLSSRGLLNQSIEALNLWESNAVKDGLRWKGEFRNPAMKIDYLNLTQKAKVRSFSVTVKPTKSGYTVKTKMGFFRRSRVKVSDLSAPIQTGIGTIQIHPNRTLSPDSVYRTVHMPKASVVASYRKAIKVSQHKKESNIINLSTTSSLPERDKALLAQIIEQYNLNAIVDKNLIATNTANFIEERLNIITRELSEAEDAVATYKERNNIADLNTQAQLFLQASSTEQKALAEIETQLSLVEYIDEFLRDDTKRNNLIPSNIGIEDPSLAGSLSEYNALQLQRMRIMRTATEDNPVVDQMNAQLATMRSNIIASIRSVRESLKIRQRNLQAQDSKYNRQIKDAPEQEREYLRYVRDQQIKERLYLYLYEKREENALMLAATSMPAKVIDIPQVDVNSRKPNTKKILMLCFLMGLMLPAGLLYLYMLFNDKIDDAKEFERRVNAPMLGQLVQNSRGTHIAIHEGESTVSAELFRLIRTNLKFIVPANIKSPVILVSSCISGEGKSYVASNLALSLAILGKKVALVGLDIRQPMLAKYFNLQDKGHLTDYLAAEEVTIDDMIVPSGEHKNLDILPCGTIPPNPSELLQTERLDELFTELRKRYDYIIVDTAPVGMVSDTYLLDRIAHATIFVCRYRYTPFEMINHINELIAHDRMRNVACVLNAVSGRISGGSYGYGYGYEYGYSNTKKD
jgi:capsular exopolysaccharide synthesis family protein